MEAKGSVFIVTGASRGLGRHLCLHYAKRGAKVAALARSEKDLASLKEAAPAGSIETYSLSVDDFDAMSKAVEGIVSKWGGIDVLINNAGVIKAETPLDLYDPKHIDLEIDTNLKGNIYACRLVSPHMMKRRSGHIINISSVGGTRGAKMPGAEVYIATKFAVNGFGDALAKYLIDFNVHVTTLCPGGIDTTIWEKAQYRHGADKELLIKPSEMADLIDFILKQRSQILFSRAILYPAPEAQEW
jgi:NADP-dependent 3-hydroxy acid dehydrogenase YdfG